MEISTQKICRKCEQELPIAQFAKNKSAKDGLQSFCKKCSCAATLEARARRKAGLPTLQQARLAAENRQCVKCGEAKPAEQFPKTRGEGRENRCNDCKKAYLRDYYAENIKDVVAEKTRTYREANPEQREAAKEKNRPTYTATNRKWYEANKDRINANLREKFATDEEARIEKLAREHARRQKVRESGTFTAKQWKALCDATGNVCLCCGEPEKLTIDHIVPVKKGGSNNISNLQPLCQSCNSKKKVKVIDYRPAHLRAG